MGAAGAGPCFQGGRNTHEFGCWPREPVCGCRQSSGHCGLFALPAAMPQRPAAATGSGSGAILQGEAQAAGRQLRCRSRAGARPSSPADNLVRAPTRRGRYGRTHDVPRRSVARNRRPRARVASRASPLSLPARFAQDSCCFAAVCSRPESRRRRRPRERASAGSRAPREVGMVNVSSTHAERTLGTEVGDAHSERRACARIEWRDVCIGVS